MAYTLKKNNKKKNGNASGRKKYYNYMDAYSKKGNGNSKKDKTLPFEKFTRMCSQERDVHFRGDFDAPSNMPQKDVSKQLPNPYVGASNRMSYKSASYSAINKRIKKTADKMFSKRGGKE